MSKKFIGSVELARAFEECLADLSGPLSGRSDRSMSCDCAGSFSSLSSLILNIVRASEDSQDATNSWWLVPFPIARLGKYLTEFRTKSVWMRRFAESGLIEEADRQKLDFFESKINSELSTAITEIMRLFCADDGFDQGSYVRKCSLLMKSMYELETRIEYMDSVINSIGRP